MSIESNTKEEILEKYWLNPLDIQRGEKLPRRCLKAMEQYAKQQVEEYLKWMDDNGLIAIYGDVDYSLFLQYKNKQAENNDTH